MIKGCGHAGDDQFGEFENQLKWMVNDHVNVSNSISFMLNTYKKWLKVLEIYVHLSKR